MKTLTKNLPFLPVLMLLSHFAYSSDYYWVGGSGDFNDLSHWATTSGGNNFYTTVPSADDNVFFDANSFSAPGQIVLVNSHIVCRDMNWTGANNPILAGHYFPLNIFGSLTLITNMTYSFDGAISFSSSHAGNTISTAGHPFNNMVSFDGNGGEWALMDNFTQIYESVYLNYGSLITNGHGFHCLSFFSDNTNSRSLNIDGSLFVVERKVTLNSTNLNLFCGSSEIRLTAYDAEFNGGNNLTFNRLIFANDTSNVLQLNGNNFFHNLVFLGGGMIKGNNTIDSLVLSAGKAYSFDINSTQFINTSWVMNGSCNAKITISSSLDGIPCNFSMATGSILGNYLVLRDIWAGGGASFIANNSVDQGNNSGWIINSPLSHNMYWVGNGGNWNDPAHWSYTSGGTGGSCVPGSTDNVYFDQNSFTLTGQKVIVNVSDASFNNMNWTGVQNTPEFYCNNSNWILRIYGSLILDIDIIFNYQGKISFVSSHQANSIITKGKVLLNEIDFDSHGGWILGDDLHSNSSIYFYNGYFNTNHFHITCNSIWDRVHHDTICCSLELDSSTIHVNNYYVDIFPQKFSAGNSTLYMDGTRAYFASYLLHNRVIFTDTSNNYASLQGASLKYVYFAGNAVIGYYNINCTYDTLILQPGFSYLLSGYHTINNHLELNGTCSRRIYLSGIAPGEGSFIGHLIILNGFLTSNYLILESVQSSGGATFIASNTIDLGGNSGWIINAAIPRDIFWVGNGGNWNDPIHWSIVSGGSGSECPPSSIDNVHFDQNSFTSANQEVNLTSLESYCRDMNWTNIQHTPSFKGSGQECYLKIYGSMHLDTGIKIQNSMFINFTSADTNNTIFAPLNFPVSAYFTGSGKWQLLSDLVGLSYIEIMGGTLITNGYLVSLHDFIVYPWYHPVKLILNHSHLNCTNFSAWNGPEILSGTSEIMVNHGFYADNFDFNKVTLDNINYYDHSNLVGSNNHFKDLRFNGDGYIDGSNTSDSLSITAGYSYVFNSESQQLINHQLNIRGNNCFPISLHSSQPGSLATLSMPSGTVTGDFLELQDIEATGGANFFAGNFSTDLGNNPGWTWGNAPGYVYGFPKDTTICQGDTLILKTDNFNGGTAWLWQDGSTNPTFQVTQSGTYSCRVTYAENCYIQDSIHVIVNPVPQMAANPMNQVICSGETIHIILSNINNVPGTSYSWTASLQTGSQTTGFSSGSGDHISQTLTNNGTTAATIIYTVTPWFRNCAGMPVSASVIVKAHASSISGKLKYDNEFNTPLSCSKVYLKTSAGVVIDSSSTDQNGNYRFCDVPNGSYKLVATTTKPWGGVNATDAFVALKHFAYLITLTGLRYTAGDVNNSGYINSVDALLMATRYVELTNSFIIGDWQFEKPTFILNGITDLNIDILGICTGDVNGSYIPPGCD